MGRPASTEQYGGSWIEIDDDHTADSELAKLHGVVCHPRMRPGTVVLILLSLVASVAACSPPPRSHPTSRRPGRGPRRPSTRRTPAPDVQPEPTSSLVRDGRAESLLAYIGSIERARGAHGRRRAPALPGARRTGASPRVLVELGTGADRKARESRSQLRDAAFEDPAEEARLFDELTRFAVRAPISSWACARSFLAPTGPARTTRRGVRELEARVPRFHPRCSTRPRPTRPSTRAW